jgi:YHS domain-containing protein
MWKYVFLLSLLVAGCASNERGTDTALSGKPHAECLVCKANADLACVDIEVEPDTPTYEYNGTTYYFCSTECRDKFAKEPQKYVNHR